MRKAPPRGGDSHVKGTEMLVAWLRGVMFGFWSHLGCFGQNVFIFRREGLVYGYTGRNITYNIYLICDDAFKNYLWVKVFDDNVFVIIKSHCIFYLSAF